MALWVIILSQQLLPYPVITLLQILWRWVLFMQQLFVCNKLQEFDRYPSAVEIGRHSNHRLFLGTTWFSHFIFFCKLAFPADNLHNLQLRYWFLILQKIMSERWKTKKKTTEIRWQFTDFEEENIPHFDEKKPHHIRETFPSVLGFIWPLKVCETIVQARFVVRHWGQTSVCLRLGSAKYKPHRESESLARKRSLSLGQRGVRLRCRKLPNFKAEERGAVIRCSCQHLRTRYSQTEATHSLHVHDSRTFVAGS